MPITKARMAFRIASGINGKTQVTKPTVKLLLVAMQNIQSPHIKFMIVPIVIPMNKVHFLFAYVSEARPITYAIIGKESINPPVGPVMDCQPPVKFEKTGRPNAPNIAYISVAMEARFAPNIIAASVIIKVWSVIGTPRGSGMESGAITQTRDAANPTIQSSRISDFLYFILFCSPKNIQKEYIRKKRMCQID